METTEVIKKHEKKFNRVRLFVKLLLILLSGIIIYLQYENILRFFKWISPNN